MSRKANPTIVGGFVLGAIALVVGGLVVFGSGSLFRQRPRAVAFFQGDIQGLSIGAPVNIRGVRVGTVTDIKIDINATEVAPVIPVYMQFEPERMNITGASATMTKSQTVLKAAIAQGLHARLASQSLVTGQLLVELSLDPSEPTRLVGADPSTIEIPTTPSDLEKLKQVLSKVPLDEIAASLLHAIRSVDEIVSSPELPSMLKSLASASDNLAELTASTRQSVPGLIANVADTSKAARATLETAQGALVDVRGTLKSSDRLVSTDLRDAVVAAKNALQHADKLLADAGTLVSTSSTQRYDLDEILKNLAATSRSLRGFTDEIDRRPNAVLIGK